MMSNPESHFTDHATRLAINGGQPVCSNPLPGWPVYGEDEIDAVDEVLRSGRTNYWTGSEGQAFEREFADYCGVRYGVAVANGSLALELALVALGMGPGDEVIVTPRTFIASASSVVLRGALPVFADVSLDSQNVTAETIEPCITERTKAVIVVHLAGQPCDMDPIVDLAGSRGLKVIEDCAQAHGARYKGRPVGSLGHIAAFSFCQDKIMSTGGEGGMLVTDDESMWRRAWAYKDHGKNYYSVHRQDHPVGFRWLHDSFGSNWRLTEMQSAIGRVQLRKLPEWHRLRVRNAEILRHGLQSVPAVRIPELPPFLEHAWYKFYFFVNPIQLRSDWDRDRLVAAINAEGIPCFTGICPELYLEQAFINSTGRYPRLAAARKLGDDSIMLLLHPTLEPSDMEMMVAAVRKVFFAAAKQ